MLVYHYNNNKKIVFSDINNDDIAFLKQFEEWPIFHLHEIDLTHRGKAVRYKWVFKDCELMGITKRGKFILRQIKRSEDKQES